MLCVGCLDYTDKIPNECVLIDTSYVLSFDTRVKDFIENVKPKNVRLIKKSKMDSKWLGLSYQ